MSTSLAEPDSPPRGLPANIVWVPIADAPDWMKQKGTQILVWCGTADRGQPVCGYYSTDAADPERRENGLVLDFNWPGMGQPSFIAAINPPKG